MDSTPQRSTEEVGLRDMRVLHVIARMNVGGTATYLANLITGLEKSSVSNLLAMGHVPEGEAEDTVVSNLPIRRVEHLSREISFSGDRASFKELNSIIDEFKPDLIHSHTFKAGLLVRLKERKVPIVHSFHGHHLYDPEFGVIKRSVLNLLERQLAKRTDAIVTIGARVQDELIDVGIGKREQYLSIPPGITALEPSDSAKVRARLGIGEKEIVVMWLGRFTQVKRPDQVLEIAKQFPEITFVMAGGGELLGELRGRVTKNVKFVGFEDKNDMWSIADIGLCTSDSEGMPLSLIEAQMAGVPVISTDVGSVSEIVDHGVTGYLASRSAQKLAGVMKPLIDSEELRKKMGTAAKKRAIDLFSADVMVQAHLRLYRSLLDKVAR